jgi:abequosyltransferase
MQFELSICIPTHSGRAKYLQKALNSIIEQLNANTVGKVEICISNNAARDNTENVIAETNSALSLIGKKITYFRWNEEVPADTNFLKAVEIAHGKYCWLLGSDDLLKPKAIETILAEIKSGENIYMFNRSDYDKNMNYIRNPTPLIKQKVKSKIFYFGSPDKLKYYLDSLASINGAFGYLACQVFKKETWNSITYDCAFTGSAYSIAYILLSILKTKSSLKYISDRLVICTLGNDCWTNGNFYNRILIDVNAYKMLINKIFSGYINTAYYTKRLLSLIYDFKIFLLSPLSKKEIRLLGKIFISDIGYKPIFFFFVRVFRPFFTFLKILKRLFK